MAEIFKPIEDFTEVIPSGNEEIQVSDTEKVTLSKIAALALSQSLSGFSSLPNTSAGNINNEDTILEAIEKIVYMLAQGQGYFFNANGASNSGFLGIAVGIPSYGTMAFALNYGEAELWLIDDPEIKTIDTIIKLSNLDLLSWIQNHVTHKAPLSFASTQTPNVNTLPISSNLKFVNSKSNISDLLKMLVAAINVGRLRIVSGNPSTGASGKPELALIINSEQGTNAETAGTVGLQIFHLTNDYIHIVSSSGSGSNWASLQTLTDEDIIKKLNSTASGDWGSLGVKLNWSGGGSGSTLKTVKVTNFKTNTFAEGSGNDIAQGEFFLFSSDASATNGPGVALHGYGIKVTAVSISYVGVDEYTKVGLYPVLYQFKSAYVYDTNWNILGTSTGISASVYELTTATDVVPEGDLKYIQVADIFRMPFGTPGESGYSQLDFIRAQDTTYPSQYVFINPIINTAVDNKQGGLNRIRVDAETGVIDMETVSFQTESFRQLFTGNIALANATPKTFSLGANVTDGDILMIVYNFISDSHTMLGNKQGRNIIWKCTSGTEDITIEALNYNNSGGISDLVSFNLMLSASGTTLTMEATGDVDTAIEAFHVVGIYRLRRKVS